MLQLFPWNAALSVNPCLRARPRAQPVGVANRRFVKTRGNPHKATCSAGNSARPAKLCRQLDGEDRTSARPRRKTSRFAWFERLSIAVSAWRTPTGSSPKAGCAGSVPGCEEGRQTRFIGFTGHKDPAIHLRILGMAREKCLHFDAVLFPSNVMDWSLPWFCTRGDARGTTRGNRCANHEADGRKIHPGQQDRHSRGMP